MAKSYHDFPGAFPSANPCKGNPGLYDKLKKKAEKVADDFGIPAKYRQVAIKHWMDLIIGNASGGSVVDKRAVAKIMSKSKEEIAASNPLYYQKIKDGGRWTKSPEGPWSSLQQAVDFAKAETGLPWKIVDSKEKVVAIDPWDHKKQRMKASNPLGAELLIINPARSKSMKKSKYSKRYMRSEIPKAYERTFDTEKHTYKITPIITGHALTKDGKPLGKPGGVFQLIDRVRKELRGLKEIKGEDVNPARRGRMKLRIRSRNKRRRSKVRKIRFGGKLLSLSQLKTKYGKRKGKSIWNKRTKRKSRVMVGMRKATRKAIGYGKKSWKALVRRFGVMGAKKHYHRRKR